MASIWEAGAHCASLKGHSVDLGSSSFTMGSACRSCRIDRLALLCRGCCWAGWCSDAGLGAAQDCAGAIRGVHAGMAIDDTSTAASTRIKLDTQPV